MNSVNIYNPVFSEIAQIIDLNKRHLFTYLNPIQQQNGFVRIEYSLEDLQTIITNKELVIVKNDKDIIGYYLIGKKSDKLTLDYQKNKALDLFESNGIQFDKIGYGCQVCINEKYRKNGLFALC